MSARASQESVESIEQTPNRPLQAIPMTGPIPRLERHFSRRARVPHLHNVFRTSPTQRCYVSRYDYDSKWQVLDTDHLSLDCEPDDADDCRRVVENIMAETRGTSTRLVVIEDICSNMVRLLSAHPGLEVEFFEQYLINSGWPASDSLDHLSDTEASTWRTRRVRKRYSSLSWYRPYLARTDPDISRMSYDISERSVSARSGIESASWSAESNTWRPHLDLRALGSTWDRDRKTSRNWTHNQALGWQERASIIAVDCIAGSQIVLVLVDRPFTADCRGNFRHCRAMPRPRLNARSLMIANRRDTSQSDGTQDIRELDNIEDADGDPSNRELEDRDSNDAGPHDTEQHHGEQQFNAQDNGDQHNRHQDRDLDGGGRGDDPSEGSVANSEQYYSASLLSHHTSRRDSQSLQQQESVNSLPDMRHLSPQRRLSQASATQTSAYYSSPSLRSRLHFSPPDSLTQESHPFINVATRGPAFATSLDNADRLGYLALSTATRGDFSAWLEHAHVEEACHNMALGPISTLFMIPFYDTIDFLAVVNDFIDEVIEAAEDSYNVELNIQKWRRLLDLLSAEFRQMTSMFPGFGDFVCESNSDDQSRSVLADPVEAEIDAARGKIVMEIDRTSSRLDMALQSLMNSLSIAASQRGIAEAEGVAKLTELAFVYIPVTFAAGIFGMNVSEIDSAKTSITGFIILAVIMVALSYFVRLLMRSSSVGAAKQSLMADVRQRAHTKPGMPVRTRDFLAWGIPGYRALYRHLFADERSKGWGMYVLVFSMIAAAFILPMSSVWSRGELISGMKTIVSIATMLVFICSLLGYWMWLILNRVRIIIRRKADEKLDQSLLFSRYQDAATQE